MKNTKAWAWVGIILLGMGYWQELPAATWVRFLAWDSSVVSARLVVQNGQEQRQVEGLHLEKRTGFYRVDDGGQLWVLAEGGERRAVAWSLGKAKKEEPVLLVVVPDAKQAGRLRVYEMDDGIGSFSWGGYRVVNCSKLAKTMEVEGKSYSIVGSGGMIEMGLKGKERGFGVKIRGQAEDELDDYSSVWVFDPNARVLAWITAGRGRSKEGISMKVVSEDRYEYADAISQREQGQGVKERSMRQRNDN